ncbi:MAG: 2-oxo acid dehydrogenase subunit E2 [Flavobacteriaceae bacterium]|nr:2-oxo acid dehydrogenase subunit E2 [Flavobacteriaceae bacterium]MDB2314235.1 2-oxo acid dehydrogenase subunit E2 [Flavobacteriaceae bacterium]
MAELINMPRLSDTMEEGTVAKWYKKVGDTVKEGDILAEIETDKATMEFESFQEGELLHIGIEEGGTAPVDSLLAIIGSKGEDIQDMIKGGATAIAPAAEPTKVPESSTEVAESKLEKPAMPEGVEVISMPRLSDTMEEGTVAKWNKKVGDPVNEGDILAEIETDKATMEFESFYSGTLLYIGLEEGQSAAVDSVLAAIGKEGTDPEAVKAAIASNAKPAVQAEEPKAEVATPAVAEQKQSPKPAPVLVQPTVVTNENLNGRLVASPLAKKLAEEKGIPLQQVKGSGDGGRIIKRDIENFKGSAVGYAIPSGPTGMESVSELANSSMRKAIAKRLSASKFSAPHYYLGVELNMDNAIAFRQQFNTLPDTKISFNDIILKAVALALKEHPQVNSQWFDDKIVQNHHVHLGVAVAVEDGLVVPVLKFTNEMDLRQIGVSVKDYALRARDKKLTPAEMDGSTFTVSNLGMFGIQEFTSIINQPNSAILSVGAIEKKPVVKEEAIVVGNTMKLTLACDHRTVDGATGAQFLQSLRLYIENPIRLLVS